MISLILCFIDLPSYEARKHYFIIKFRSKEQHVLTDVSLCKKRQR